MVKKCCKFLNSIDLINSQRGWNSSYIFIAGNLNRCVTGFFFKIQKMYPSTVSRVQFKVENYAIWKLICRMQTWKIYQVWYCLFQYRKKQIKCIPTSTRCYIVIFKTFWLHCFISKKMLSSHLQKHADLRSFLCMHVKDLYMKLAQSEIYHRSICTSILTIKRNKCIIFYIDIFYNF